MPLVRHRTASRLAAGLALSPALLVLVVVYLGCTAWTVWISLTSSRMLPNSTFVGLRQYASLMGNERWQVSVANLAVFGSLFLIASLALGFLLAVAIDQRVRAENTLRSIFLYPYSMSFIVTGLVWQWLLNPSFGIEKMVRDLGFPSFHFDWIVRQDMVIYTLVFAAVWHAAGLVMAIMLAGLRGIDEDIWKAARIDGLPPWRVYLSIVIPMLGASFATAAVLLATSVVRLYDLSVAMTNGGPGVASEVPAKFVMDHLFERGNLGLATAAATSMLITVAAVVAPWLVWQNRRARRAQV
ncbi:carbohydrate ABC transporter membrane protein 1, CUT1 family (TC 3.A.1.1.-) [Bosea sp. OK403]|uniref:carbohydrate ABC transporter permease n=1 Tax=Bosea sp. OK403 TaxID=1855286 RepID=UPI0008EB2F3A|nr:sugar ABC transporter permease [Bosea sp. OK403]SFI14344.1 carbohydrate ABC transporter membrane protein 1, CUT1 family (TC 3.A.1.1.-) [Bosea sp. OK403]